MISRPNSKKSNNGNLFYGSLSDMLDLQEPIIALSHVINWDLFEKEFSKHYSHEGRPAKPIRLMVGLLLLKQLNNQSDEDIVINWKQNPYYQYFCGYNEYIPALPCHSTELVKFRQRIGVDGMKFIFKHSIAIHGKIAEEKQVIIDSTVQEKNITYPTDGKLAIRMINHLHKIAKKENLKLRRTYVREIKEHRINLRFFRHPKRSKKARSSTKRLRTIVGILIRDISKNLSQDKLSIYQEKFDLFDRVRKQQIKDKNKVLSIHEQHVYSIGKGKDHKKYEYGVKASVVTTKKSGIIVGVTSHKENIHDSKTLDEAIKLTNENRKTKVKEAICDRGYRGVKQMHGATISIPSTKRKKDTPYQIQKKREKFKSRSKVEPIIGHLKSDFRLAKTYLKGFMGDQINLLLAATAFNLRKWMRIYFFMLFLGDFRLIQEIIKQIKESIGLYIKLMFIKIEYKLS